MFLKVGFLKNFAIFTEKHLYCSLSFNKVAGLRPATLLKERLQYRCFPVNIAKLLRAAFFIEHLRWLRLYILDGWQGSENTCKEYHSKYFRSSHPGVFWKKWIKTFAEFTGKHLCQSLFLNKVTGFRPATLLTRKLQHRF